jgi:transmembrane sensor
MQPARDIEAIAATWLSRREEPDWSQIEEAELQTWLDESYAHKAAYWRLESGWRAADRISALGPTAAAAEPSYTLARPKWQWMAIAASFAAMLLAVPAAMHVPPTATPTSLRQYRTPLGGHQQVALSDGSTVELNTATIIRAAISSHARDVWLDNGEAFFSVRHLAVPFVVHAGSRLVTVLGTKFSVLRDGDKVHVAVIEGRVRVSDVDSADPAPIATIDKGDMLEVQGDSTLVMQNAEHKVEQSLAWREGMLEFEQTPLLEAASEFNRYNRHKLVVTGRAAMIPIGGSFKASNVDDFARLLHEAYGLRVEEAPSKTTIST